MKQPFKETFLLIKDSALYNTFVVTVGAIVAAFFGYLLQLFLGRTISVSDFGTFSALLSLSFLLNVPSSVFGMSLVKTVVDIAAKDNYKKLTTLFWKLVIYSLMFALFVCILFWNFGSYISTSLGVDDDLVVKFFGVVIGLSFFMTIIPSFFQGLLRYKAYAAANMLASFLSLFIPLAFVIGGYGLYGIFGGMSFAILITFLISYLALRKNLTKYESNPLSDSYKKIITFSLPVLFMQFSLMLLNNIDMILVKKYFDPMDAGYYAGTVTLGKILLFGASSVATVMFPMISSLFSKGQAFLKKFYYLFFLQLLIVGCGVLVFTTMPDFITHLFFGESFIKSIPYLPSFSIFIGLFVLINFSVLFFLAIEEKKVFLFLVPGLIVQYILIKINHETLYDVINANIITGIITLLLLGLFFIFSTGALKFLWHKKEKTF